MTNLLPIPAQRAAWREYRARIIIVGSAMLAIIASITAILLVPSYMAIEIAAPVTPVPVTRDTSDVDPAGVARAGALIGILGPIFAPTSTPSAGIEAVLSRSPSGMVIDHISYAADLPPKITIGGVATRDELNAFRNALQSSGLFSSVSIPVGALVGAEGGRFSMTVIML